MPGRLDRIFISEQTHGCEIKGFKNADDLPWCSQVIEDWFQHGHRQRIEEGREIFEYEFRDPVIQRLKDFKVCIGNSSTWGSSKRPLIDETRAPRADASGDDAGPASPHDGRQADGS